MKFSYWFRRIISLDLNGHKYFIENSPNLITKSIFFVLGA